ncbi:MAG: hypothetical protein RMJ98_13975 [Myxococcales bacterium]|nr:hypothetical protein [Polyangiaceae bacterium]MDW8250399.1 hypothetical protein [Myxococcales bacterium]
MPGSGPPPDPVIYEAQGVLRDAVSAAQNLLVLLSSLRVAPQIIRPLLSEVRTSIEATPAALEALLRRLTLQRDAAVLPLLSFLQTSTDETSRALRSAETSPFEARSRLLLESSFRRMVPRLDAVRELAELLVYVRDPAIDLDLAELLETSFYPTSCSGLSKPSLQLVLDAPPRGAHPIRTNPRAASRLLRLVLGYSHGGAHPGRSVSRVNLRTRPSPPRVECLFSEPSIFPQGDVLLTRVPLLIPPTASILAFFCASCSIHLVLQGDSSVALLAFPPG